MTTVYVFITLALFGYTLNKQIETTSGYFTTILAYMSNDTNLFIAHNFILSIVILFYKLIVWIFF